MHILDLEEPLFFINNIHSSESTKDLQENIPFNVSCLVEGNPVPNVRLFKGTENISTNRENTKWANHTVISAECEDTGNYTCTGSSEGFNVSGKTFRINILCKYNCIFLPIYLWTWSMLVDNWKKKYYSNCCRRDRFEICL